MMAPPDDLSTSGGGSRPDPSALTTAVLQREIQNTRDYVSAEILHTRDLIQTRLDAMDKAIELVAQYPTRMDEKIAALRELIESIIKGMAAVRDEQFRGIDQRFHERDLRAEQRIVMSETALNAALASAKESVSEQNRSSATAISKSELAMDKRIAQMEQLMGSTAAGLDAKIDSNKNSITRIEGRVEGQANARATSQQGVGMIIGIISVLFLLGGAVVTIVLFVSRVHT